MKIETVPTENFSSRHGKDVIGIILHFTAGGDINGTLKWFSNPKAGVSAHYVVSRSGRVVRMVDEKMAAWHAGSSTTTPKLNGEKHLNSKTIGIEICNWGWLFEAPFDDEVVFNGETYKRKSGNLYTRFRKWSYPFHGSKELHSVTSKVLTSGKNPFPTGDTCHYWEAYYDNQMTALETLMLEILDRYPHISRKWIARHQDVDPTRKLDTGPAFDFEAFLDRLFPPVKMDDDQYEIGRRKEDNVTDTEMEEAYEPRVETNLWGCKR